MFRSLGIAVLVLLAGALSACGESDRTDAVALENASRALRPANAELAETYDRSCRSCHTVAATGAPLTGDSAGWAARMDKGMNTLVDNVINGFGGMPPFGLCMDCGPQEFEDLIRFMAEGQ